MKDCNGRSIEVGDALMVVKKNGLVQGIAKHVESSLGYRGTRNHVCFEAINTGVHGPLQIVFSSKRVLVTESPAGSPINPYAAQRR